MLSRRENQFYPIFKRVNCPRNASFIMKREHACKQLPQSGCQDTVRIILPGKLCVHNLLHESPKMDNIALKTEPTLLALSPPVSGIQMQW